MSPLEEVRALLAEHGLRTKKALGQNFLIDEEALDGIARAALNGAPEALVEIGPGPGTLTQRLASSGLALIAVEKDQALLPMLRARFAEQPHVQIQYGDALEVDYRSLHPGLRTNVVGNIPYNISSPLLLRLLAQRHGLGSVTLMLQKEVVERLVAAPNSKAYGSLSVLFQTVGVLRQIRQVPAAAFFPAPKVDSMVLQIEWRDPPLVPDAELPQLERTVRAAFSLRRKMMRNSLRTLYTVEAVEAAAAATGLAMTRRAETLTLQEFSSLAAALPPTEGPWSPADPP